jgi:hypothetical protein
MTKNELVDAMTRLVGQDSERGDETSPHEERTGSSSRRVDRFAWRGSANRGTLLKVVLIAGGVAALTAGSAGISSLRRRKNAHSCETASCRAGITMTAPVALTAAIDRSGHLSDGALVQTSVRARLLRASRSCAATRPSCSCRGHARERFGHPRFSFGVAV